ncbi:hypothetical protein [Moorena sp. SIO3I6]|uniref:hypothetical protein n=1 Tax=Moorena sp. SIO3I6 TaxID=2607831 RepID=UPI0013FAB2AE|nr:hypothetical protein [Moorena sp. SIO3I6]NEP27390.1 hypothetical protein [Moorena sp. SIO3I6]
MICPPNPEAYGLRYSICPPYATANGPDSSENYSICPPYASSHKVGSATISNVTGGI